MVHLNCLNNNKNKIAPFKLYNKKEFHGPYGIEMNRNIFFFCYNFKFSALNK